MTPQLNLCAHVDELVDDPEERWNSGDYDFPAGLSEEPHELGAAWWTALEALHAAAADEPEHGPVYQGLVALCSSVLLDLRREGLVPDGIDLNVAEVGDDVDLVATRHAMLTEGRIPDGGTPWSPDAAP